MRSDNPILTRSEACGGGGAAQRDATEGALSPLDAPFVTMRIRNRATSPVLRVRRRSP
jgi:hypothetical protein